MPKTHFAGDVLAPTPCGAPVRDIFSQENSQAPRRFFTSKVTNLMQVFVVTWFDRVSSGCRILQNRSCKSLKERKLRKTTISEFSRCIYTRYQETGIGFFVGDNFPAWNLP